MTAVHQRRRRRGYRWSVHLEPGHGQRMTTCRKEATRVTHVSLLDPASAVGQAVDAWVTMMGGRDFFLGSLSTERPRLELEPPFYLHQEFGLAVTLSDQPDPDADYTDSDSDADTDSDSDSDSDADAIVVNFQGIVFLRPPPGKEEEEEESDGTDTDDDEDDMSSDDEDDDSSDEEEEESDGEEEDEKIAVHTEHVRPIAAEGFSVNFVFVYLITFVILVMYYHDQLAWWPL